MEEIIQKINLVFNFSVVATSLSAFAVIYFMIRVAQETYDEKARKKMKIFYHIFMLCFATNASAFVATFFAKILLS